MRFNSSKTYGHDAGFSCAFRQWRATSHCNQVHGYALQVRIEWEADELDERNWVTDFGAVSKFKPVLVGLFDHKTVVAKDDPELKWFEEAARRKILDLVIVEAVGCERFAQMVFDLASEWTDTRPELSGRAFVKSVTINEHHGNSATANRVPAQC